MERDDTVEYRLMNEYGVDWPIWGDTGDGPPDEPKLSPRLAAGVRSWAATFNDLYSYEGGWPDARTDREHRRRGEQLLAAIQREVGPNDSIVLQYWEENDRGGSYWETQQRLR